MSKKPSQGAADPVEEMHASTRGHGHIPPVGPVAGGDDVSWDEAESTMRQLEKELQAAKGAHAALRKAREAGEAVARAEQEHARLTAEIEALRMALDGERERAALERTTAASEFADREIRHAESVQAMRTEIDDLGSRLAIARQTAKDADANMKREHEDAAASRRHQIDALDREKARIEASIAKLKADVLGTA